MNLGAGAFSQWSSPGDFAINPAGYDNKIIVDQHHRVDMACVPWTALLTSDEEGLLPGDSDLGAVHAQMAQDAVMSSLLDRLWKHDQSDTGSLQEDVALLAIKERLLSWLGKTVGRKAAAVEKLSPRQLARCEELLLRPVTNSPTLSDLAALCNLSQFHFCRAFKAATGLPPHRYQIAARIERARDMLLKSQLSIAEVGTAVGYDDPAYFSRLFARETGATPSNWRKEASK